MAPKIRDNQNVEAEPKLEQLANSFTNWVGSPASIIVHTILFVAAFVFVLFGVPLNTVLLVLTTAVSLEAIYLALFIQMTVNKNTQALAGVEEDIEEIAEDVEEVQKDVDEIQKDVDEIQEDIEEDVAEEQIIEAKEANAIHAIQTILTQLQRDIDNLKK